MIHKVEIDEHALLNQRDRKRVLAYMKKCGTVQTLAQASINYGGEKNALELRVKEQTLLLVDITRAKRRVVEQARLADGSFLGVLADLARQGHTNAHVSLRRVHQVEHNNLVYLLRDVLHFDNPKLMSDLSLFELEQDIFDGHDERSRTLIHQTFKRLKVQPLSNDDYASWLENTHNNIDGTFTYSAGNAVALAMKLQSAGYKV